MTGTPFILNTDSRARVGAALASGVALYRSTLPANWTIEFDFGLAPGHTTTASFTLDGKPARTFEQPPYTAGTDHYAPLVLADGSHSIGVTAGGEALAPFTFSLAAAPPVRATPGVWGWNLSGANYPACDSGEHPQLAQLLADTGAKWVRLWLEIATLKKTAPDKYWSVARAYRKAGVSVMLVLQYENQQAMWSDGDLTWMAQSIPADAVSALSMGNEVDTDAYFKGTSGALVHASAVVAPMIKAKGIKLVAPCPLHGVQWCESFAAQGGYAMADAADFHTYQSSAQQIISDAQGFADFCQKKGIPGFISEWGTRPYGGTPPQEYSVPAWADEQAKAISGMCGLGLTIMPYSAFPMEDKDIACPLDKNYARTGFYASYVGAMKP
jgi:SH3-like domain-containing protein